MGLHNNIKFLHNCASHPSFGKGEVDTGFIQRYQEQVMPATTVTPNSAIAIGRRKEPWCKATGPSLTPLTRSGAMYSILKEVDHAEMRAALAEGQSGAEHGRMELTGPMAQQIARRHGSCKRGRG